MTTRILVTGASGFVGEFLLDELVKNTDNQIVALHLNALDQGLAKRYSDRVQWAQADLRQDPLEGLVRDIDIVYHLAAYSTIGETAAEKQLLLDLNVTATDRLAKACQGTAVRQMIFVSSIAACEFSDQAVITEETGHPETAYGLSKKQAEKNLLKMPDRSFQVSILRPTALFGERHGGSIFELMRYIQAGRFMIIGSGENRTNFYYIRDFIDLMVGVQDNAKAFSKTYIAADQSYSLKTLSTWIAEALGCGSSVFKLSKPAGYLIAMGFEFLTLITRRAMPLSRKRLIAMTRDVSYSNQKVMDELRIPIRFGVQHGIRATVEWHRQQANL